MSRVVKSLLLLAVVASLTFGAVSVSAQSWSTESSFSMERNPNGDWSYGYIDESDQFVLYNTVVDLGSGLSCWALDWSPDIAGNLVINTGDSALDKYGVCWEPARICIQPGISGTKAVLRWISNASATVQIRATFSAQAFSTTADIRIVRNGYTKLCDGEVDGFSGSTATRRSRVGIQPLLVCSSTTRVTPGDTIDFVVGNDGTSGMDQVAVDVLISTTDNKASGDRIDTTVTSQYLPPLLDPFDSFLGCFSVGSQDNPIASGTSIFAAITGA